MFFKFMERWRNGFEKRRKAERQVEDSGVVREYHGVKINEKGRDGETC
jgi:hypothetical protein